LLILFALLRSVLWASVQPAFFAPDEDYHWLYINYLVEKGTVPKLNGPFYTAELYRAVYETHQGQYFLGPRTAYTGSPHAVLKLLAGPSSEREPAPPKPRPVLHPPGYHLGGALVDLLLNNKVSVTRMTGIRYYSAVLGALTIFFAWLLAAQVFAREWERLAAAAVAATQPILAFSASTITNDVAVAAVLTAALAYCTWMLRGPPRGRQGVGLGVLLSAALFVKATMFSLLIVITAVFLLAWRTYPLARRELVRAIKWVILVPVLLVGWWYAYLLVVTGSILGDRAGLTSAHGAHGPGLLHAPVIAWHWFSDVYRSYWFDYNSYEVRHEDLWFWLPLVGAGLVIIGLALVVKRLRGTLTVPDRPALRQVVVLGLIPLVLLAPPLAVDVVRGAKGLGFMENQGRFLVPAYPGLAVIAVLALRELTARLPRAYPTVLAVWVAFAFVFYWHTWIVWVLERFYGPVAGHWLRSLRHASFDKPTFITAASLAAMLIGALASFVVAYLLTLSGAGRPGGQRRDDSQDERKPVDETFLAAPVEVRFSAG
jgi:hypothetical protein